jgi:branched-chain amino acid transport system permease protein
MNFFWNILILINIYGLLCLGNNFTIGYSGLLNLACAAVFAIGSYSVALLMTELNANFLMALLMAVIVSAVFSLIVGIGTMRYKRTSFALASLACQILVLSTMRNMEWTRGTLGIHGIPAPSIGGVTFEEAPDFWMLSTVFLGIGLALSSVLQRSRWALTLQAVRDDEVSAISLGKNAGLLRIQAFVVSSIFIGVAGALFATYIQYIDPSSFSLDESIFLLLALVCGGTCNTVGPLVGAVFAIVLPEWLRFLDVPAAYAAGIRNIVFGIIVIALMRVRPQGIAGRYAIE